MTMTEVGFPAYCLSKSNSGISGTFGASFCNGGVVDEPVVVVDGND